MKSRQLLVVEQALIVSALRLQGGMIGADRETNHSLAREFMEGYAFVVDDEKDAQLLADLIANPVGMVAPDAQSDTQTRTIQSDLLEDR